MSRRVHTTLNKRVLKCFAIIIAWLDGAEVSASGWGLGGPRFRSHRRLTFQSRSRYQLNQLGSKAASESTFKKSNTCGVSNNRLYFNVQTERGKPQNNKQNIPTIGISHSKDLNSHQQCKDNLNHLLRRRDTRQRVVEVVSDARIAPDTVQTFHFLFTLCRVCSNIRLLL